MKKFIFSALFLLSCGLQVCWDQSKEVTVGLSFEGGFKHDSVQVFLNGGLKYSNQNVTTRAPGKSDYAASTELKLKVKKDFSDINVLKIVINKKCVLELPVTFLKSKWFGISQKDGHISLTINDQPVGYV